MKLNLSNLPFPTKLTVAGLVACAFAISIQWLSGDPSYPKFPPGPVFFIAIAAIVAFGARWWWTPLIGSLIALLVTSGWFARLPRQIERLTHPGSIGRFAPDIFLGTLGMIVVLLLTDVAGFVATVLNYRSTMALALPGPVRGSLRARALIGLAHMHFFQGRRSNQRLPSSNLPLLVQNQNTEPPSSTPCTYALVTARGNRLSHTVSRKIHAACPIPSRFVGHCCRPTGSCRRLARRGGTRTGRRFL